MALTKARREKYLKKQGNTCPYCNSKDIRTIGPAMADCNYLTRDIQCLDCGKMWTDIYTLSDIEE